ncbi:hypothetical protein MTR67_033709 [Solanum verrucosum]|uniref:SWIM-type domain-containing protein n=1 Tax=Solanum verrucosum TaxID=315347 RepID=A0AAF0ZKL5_SOLVR|nr:hypothetical protein MTR67_033709 [Solanum verrucosum]
MAVCKDGNNQRLPLAWAVVEVENTFTWKWFIKLVRHDLELGDGTELTAITDMQKGLDKAIQDLLPNAEQRMCARHVLANWSKNWKGIERRNCFWRCAKSTYEQELKRNLDHMEKLGTGICDDLLWYNIERWSKLYFKFFSCCDSVDNNMAESFNSWILGPRHKTIITMLEEIRIKVMRRIGQLREFCDTWITNISPMALKVLTENTTKSMKCNIEWNGEYGFEVKNSWDNTFVVNLGNQTCTCRSWMLRGIPCCHVIAALHFRKLEPINYVAHWYSKETYLKVYSHYIQPVTNMKMWPQSANSSVIPPVIKTLPRRPRKCRRKEQNENKTGKLSKRGRGRGMGKGCEPSSTRSSVGSSRAPTESQSSTKRGRGRPRGSTKQANATGRGRGTATGNGTGIGVAADSSGATGRGRGTGTGLAGRGRRTSVVATATDVPGATGRGKRPRMVGMGILHTQSGFTIHNPGMPMNSSVVTGNLGHHKPRSGLKWKGKAAVTQQGLQEMRENKRMRTRSNVAEV